MDAVLRFAEREESYFCAFTEGPGMKHTLAWLLVPFLFAGPIHAENGCSECLKAADEALRVCVENAISVEDKNSCEDKQEEQAKRCENSECKAERENREASSDAPSQGR